MQLRPQVEIAASLILTSEARPHAARTHRAIHPQRLLEALAALGRLMDALEHQLGQVREITGQKRNRVYAYTAYIDILNRD